MREDKIRGWFKNPERKRRRDRSGTLTDSQVMQLIKKIETIDKYTKLDRESDRLVRLRDKALIALSWIFFKRANEILRVRLADVYYDENELSITFHISKKKRSVKVCPSCNEGNGKRAKYCRKCGFDIRNVKVEKTGGSVTVIKRKSMEYPFCRHVVEWVETAKKLRCKPEDFIFPPYNCRAGGFMFGSEEYEKNGRKVSPHRLTVQRFDQILQRLDPSLSTHMFRYGAAEKFLRLGYSVHDLKEIGDWSSTRMPEVYAGRKGLTPSQTRFMKDTRMV